MSTQDAVRRWHAELAWLPGRGVHSGVFIEASGRHFTAVTPGAAAGDCPPGTVRLPGFTLPGLANAHSHAFHRALRGAAQAGQGTFAQSSAAASGDTPLGTRSWPRRSGSTTGS